MADDLERITYDNALRALDKQERVLEELRARTSVLIAASSLAVSLLGGRGLAGDGSAVLLTLALVAFMVSLGASLLALLPSEHVVFALAPQRIYERLYAAREDPAQLHQRLALELQRHWEANARHVETIRRTVGIAAWSLGVEILALIVLLRSTL